MQPVIHQANLVRVFELILIILIVYYAFSFIMRYIVPSLLKKHLNDFQQRFTDQSQHNSDTRQTKKEGEISITYIDKEKSKTRNPDDAEYVDYEEIK